MKVRAPGKLLLTGAYAVLDGAPALVVAVDRYAIADPSLRAEAPTAEAFAALGDRAPAVDASALFAGDQKLGLGSSAAVVVASIAAREVERGVDLDAPGVRGAIFARARDAHASVQSGGSGVDVAASTYGGVLQYSLLSGTPCVLRASLPTGLHVAIYFSGASARTSTLRAQVDALSARDPEGHRSAFLALGGASERAVEMALGGTAGEFVAAARAFGEALEHLGERADTPIVPLAFTRLAVAAADEGATFLPSGAGGGDVGVFLGKAPPSEEFERRATLLGMTAVGARIDTQGVCVLGADAPPGSTNADWEGKVAHG